MSKPIEFFLPGHVHPKQSYRHNPVTHASGKVTYGHASTKQRNNQKALAGVMALYAPGEPFCGPVRVHLVFLYPWRKSESLAWRKRGRRPKTTKPDCEQIHKQTLEAMEKAGFFVNDSQVFNLHAFKWWYSGIEGVDVLVEEVSEVEVSEEASSHC